MGTNVQKWPHLRSRHGLDLRSSPWRSTTRLFSVCRLVSDACRGAVVSAAVPRTVKS